MRKSNRNLKTPGSSGTLDNLEISFDVSQEQISQIEEWLKQEDNDKGEVFFCNWNIILDAHIEKHFATITNNGKVLGFAAWSPR